MGCKSMMEEPIKHTWHGLPHPCTANAGHGAPCMCCSSRFGRAHVSGCRVLVVHNVFDYLPLVPALHPAVQRPTAHTPLITRSRWVPCHLDAAIGRAEGVRGLGGENVLHCHLHYHHLEHARRCSTPKRAYTDYGKGMSSAVSRGGGVRGCRGCARAWGRNVVASQPWRNPSSIHGTAHSHAQRSQAMDRRVRAAAADLGAYMCAPAPGACGA